MQAAALFGLCVAALVSSSWAEPPAAVKTVILDYATKCQEKVGATEDDLGQVKDHKIDSDGAKEKPEKSGKTTSIFLKIMACVAKDSKLLVDGKFSVEGSLELAREILEAGGVADVDKQLETAKEISTNCGTEINDQKLETDDDMTKAIFTCLHKGAAEKGLFLPDV